MKINKFQGQNFDKVKLYVSAPVFEYGQIYVAFPQVRRIKDVKVL